GAVMITGIEDRLFKALSEHTHWKRKTASLELYAAPVAQAGQVPEGWKLVPLEPTEQILEEFDSIVDYGAEDSRDAWRRLLAVAGDRHEA
ncbi:hypothetical protein HBO32_12010, partial [Pseudomonas nitroreducens]|uniref:hypothetical protein n=1 Tax=Pseudomonas nitroreducens TaxID=46680 RepID=UPI00179371A2